MKGRWGWQRLGAVALSLALGAVDAWAAVDSCSQYRITWNAGAWSGYPAYDSGWHNSKAEACAALTSWEGRADGYKIVAGRVSEGNSNKCEIQRSWQGGAPSGWMEPPGNPSFLVQSVECPPDPCADYAGVKTALSSSTGTAIPETACHAVGGSLCRFKLAGVGVVLPGAGGWSATMEVTGESCSLSDDLGPMGECIVMEGGRYACVDRSSKDATANSSCGEVNGAPVCLEDVPEGGCALLADGGLICAASEDPRLDGEGNPVAADARLGLGGSGGDTKEFDYFGPGTAGDVIAGGSVSVVSSPGSVSGIPRPGVADGVPGPDGEGVGGEGEGDPWDAGEGMSGVISALSGNSWLGVLTSAASALSGSASCPSVMLDFELLGGPLDIFEAACGYMEPYYGMWVAMMQIAWGLLAFRIFWKGVRE